MSGGDPSGTLRDIGTLFSNGMLGGLTDKQLLVRCDEAFSKPGATVSVRIGLDPAKPAEPSSDLRLGWQWWSGQWNALGESTPTGSSGVTDGTLGLRRDGSVGFDVPIGWSAGPDGGLWLLVEVQQGGYGSAPPAIALLDLAYDWSRPRLRAPTLRAEVDRSGRRLDQAFTNVVEVDLTKDFAPFGLRPTIGDTLYLACDDAFSPPRDSVELDVELTSPAAASEPPPAAAGPQLTLR